MRIVALDPASQPGDITVEVTDPGGDEPSEDVFKLMVKQGGQVVEKFDRATLGRGSRTWPRW